MLDDNVSHVMFCKHNSECKCIESAFAERRIPLTSQRKAIWRFFTANTHAYTVQDVYEAIKSRRIGQATVYRTVCILLEMGLLRRIVDSAGITLFAAVQPGHNHPLICHKCHEILDFDVCDLSVLEKLLVAQTGYTIQGHRLEIFGVCPKCQA
jgi:Fe2+ or Zn2+ uptake regulation protein